MAQPAAAQDKKNIAWGGSNPGGVMYYMVGAAGTIISEKLPQYNINQVTTGGSTENAKRLIKGELDMGIVYGAHVYMALKSAGSVQGRRQGHDAARRGQGLQGADLLRDAAEVRASRRSQTSRARRWRWARRARAPCSTATTCSQAIGILGDIKARYMTFADAGRALGNGQIDALCQSSAPAAAVKELAETRGAVVLPYWRRPTWPRS